MSELDHRLGTLDEKITKIENEKFPELLIANARLDASSFDPVPPSDANPNAGPHLIAEIELRKVLEDAGYALDEYDLSDQATQVALAVSDLRKSSIAFQFPNHRVYMDWIDSSDPQNRNYLDSKVVCQIFPPDGVSLDQAEKNLDKSRRIDISMLVATKRIPLGETNTRP